MIKMWTNQSLLAELFYMGIEADSGILEHSKVDLIVEQFKDRHIISDKEAEELKSWLKDM